MRYSGRGTDSAALIPAGEPKSAARRDMKIISRFARAYAD
jgi:hypothetical protein